MARGRRGGWREWALTAPSLGWLLLFFLVPTGVVFAIAFRPVDPWGGIGEGWTLDTLRAMANPNYPSIIWRTVWLSVAAAAVSLALAIPVGYHIARLSPRWRAWILMLIIVPSWTTFLVRIFAWKVLLHSEGILRRSLVEVGLLDDQTRLLDNAGAVLLVLVYVHLPFAILPIYAAAEKFDFGLTEAARDLGATPWQAFYKVFLPGVRRGVATASLMVLVPCLGAYVIPELMGGATSDMIGNVIARRAFNERNLPQAAALAAVLTVVVTGVLLATLAWQRRRGDDAPPTL